MSELPFDQSDRPANPRQEEVDNLRRVSESLERSVENLTLALNETSAIQRRQVELEEQARRAEEAAAAAQVTAAAAVPREEQERKEAEAAEAERLRRHKTRRRVFLTTVIAVLITAALVTSNIIAITSAHTERHDFNQLRTATIAGCQSRATDVAIGKRRDQTLADLLNGLKATPAQAEAVKAFQDAATAESGKVDCSRYLNVGH